MRYTISSTYVLKYQLKNSPQYKWSECGRCFNTKTGNEIKKVLNGRSIGYCINGKFRSLTSLRKQLVSIKVDKCPF